MEGMGMQLVAVAGFAVGCVALLATFLGLRRHTRPWADRRRPTSVRAQEPFIQVILACTVLAMAATAVAQGHRLLAAAFMLVVWPSALVVGEIATVIEALGWVVWRRLRHGSSAGAKHGD